MPSVLEKISNFGEQIPSSGIAVLKVEKENNGPEKFECLFNPEEYNLKVQGKFATKERSQNDSPIVQYAGGESDSLDLTLFFDTSGSKQVNMSSLVSVIKVKEATDVSKYTKKLAAMIKMDGKLHRPPIVEFCWGSLSFTGFVDNVGIQYTMFEKDGKPVRAKVTLHMQAVGKGDSKGNPLQSPDRTKCRILTAGSDLSELSKIEYANAGCWRLIANANHIMDPMAVLEGTVLSLPPLID